LIKNIVSKLTEEVPDPLDSKIMNKVYSLDEKNKNENIENLENETSRCKTDSRRIIKFYRYAVVGLAIILISFLLLFLNSFNNLEQKLYLSD